MDENKNVNAEDITKADSGRLFRTAVNGFNRQDVVSYIARLARSAQDEKDEYLVRLRELTDTRDKLLFELVNAKNFAAETAGELAALKERGRKDIDEVLEKARLEQEEKDGRIAQLEKEAELSHQLALALRAENEILSQRIFVAEHAARAYWARADEAERAPEELKKTAEGEPLIPPIEALSAEMIAGNAERAENVKNVKNTVDEKGAARKIWASELIKQIKKT